MAHYVKSHRSKSGCMRYLLKSVERGGETKAGGGGKVLRTSLILNVLDRVHDFVSNLKDAPAP